MTVQLKPIQWLDRPPPAIYALRPRPAIKTTNPLGHPYPHAKLRNVTLTSIARLRHNTEGLSRHLIPNDDPRNYTISRRAQR